MSALANELQRFLDFMGKQGQQPPTRRLRVVEIAPGAPLDPLGRIRVQRLPCPPCGRALAPTSRRRALRRILMPRSSNHVYSVIDEPMATVHVLAGLGSPAGTTPKL